MGQSVPHNWEAVDAAIAGGLERALSFLEALVAEPSIVGNEAGAQRVVARELARLGFAVSELEVPETIATRPGSGVPALPYDDRPVVVGRRAGSGRSLLVNGHVDVVPPGAADLWPGDPFAPRRSDGWLHGRGAGDMKAGFATALL